MNYHSGETVALGDRVRLGNDPSGVVVCVIDSGAYSPYYPESQWGYLKRGTLIDFPTSGLIHYEMEMDEGVKLIARAAS